MLKRMKRKGDPDRYSFGECCLFVAMIAVAIISFICIAIVAGNLIFGEYWALVWLLPCGVVAVVCCAGLMYVLGRNGDYGGDGDDDEY